MTPADPKTLAAAIGALILITTGVATGIYFVKRDAGENPRHFTVEWTDAGVPEGDVRCVWTTALVGPEMLAIYGARTDAGSQYAYARICMEVLDDGGVDQEAMAELMPGVEAMEFEQMKETYDGGPRFTAILQGEEGWPCACSRGIGGCEWMPWYSGGQWLEAPNGMTFTAGKWRGDDCFPKACNELSGTTTSWPPECPTQ